MLILSRKCNEAIIIDGGRITVRVLQINEEDGTRRVKLGVIAPRETAVHREEVQQRIDGTSHARREP